MSPSPDIVFEWLKQDIPYLKRDVTSEFIKSRGPGGQKVNKTQSAVRLTHRPSGIVIKCDKYRKREENMTSAYRRLRKELAFYSPTDLDPEEHHLVKSYISNGFKIQSNNPALPHLFRVVSNLFNRHEGDRKEVAKELSVSPSSLLKFLKKHKLCSDKINQIRGFHGKSPLKMR